MPPQIHILRHGEAHHNTHPCHRNRDPPLTKSGHHATTHKHLPFHPDLILISPLTRTIQTAINLFPFLSSSSSSSSSSSLAKSIPAHIWPDLRETHTTSPCNQCSPRRELEAAFPQFDFGGCSEEGGYEGDSDAEAGARAERVRAELKRLANEEGYRDILLITHKGLKEYLVKGRRFGLADVRTYRFASDEAAREEGVRWGVDWETGVKRDYGPTVLVVVEAGGREGGRGLE